MTDTTSMNGAEFRREVGTDPVKWAEAFLAAYAKAEGLHTEADRLAFVTSWFRDAMDAAVKNGIWKISARAGYGTKWSE